MSEVQRIERAQTVTTTLARPLVEVTQALEVYRDIVAVNRGQWHWEHHARHVTQAAQFRNLRLRHFLEVQRASRTLWRELYRKLDRRTAASIVGVTFRALGVKPGD